MNSEQPFNYRFHSRRHSSPLPALAPCHLPIWIFSVFLQLSPLPSYLTNFLHRHLSFCSFSSLFIYSICNQLHQSSPRAPWIPTIARQRLRARSCSLSCLTDPTFSGISFVLSLASVSFSAPYTPTARSLGLRTSSSALEVMVSQFWSQGSSSQKRRDVSFKTCSLLQQDTRWIEESVDIPSLDEEPVKGCRADMNRTSDFEFTIFLRY